MKQMTKLKIKKLVNEELNKKYCNDSASSVGGALMIGITSLLTKIKNNLKKAKKIEKEAAKKGIKPKRQTKNFFQKNHRIVFNIEKELKNLAKGGAVFGTGAAGISAVNNESDNKETIKQMEKTINILKKHNKDIQEHLNKANDRMYELSKKQKVADSPLKSIFSKLKKEVKKGEKIQKKAKKENRKDKKIKKHYSLLQKIKLFLKGSLIGGGITAYGIRQNEDEQLKKAQKAEEQLRLANNNF